eukprot:jgi/Botrbrau1/541/Bobra.0010s0016.1
MVKLSVVNKAGKDVIPGGLSVPGDSVDDLRKAFAKAKPAMYIARQRFTLPLAEGEKKPTVLGSGKKLSDYGLTEGSKVVFKDLGPQVGYSTVFFWEYFGPIWAYAFFYFLPQFAYPWAKTIPEKSVVQQLALAYWVFHYVKRILETFFVHKFSHATMPLRNLMKNCSYYWGFAALVSYFINHPLYTSPSAERAYVCFSLALICQLLNWRAHVVLANLRPAGKTTGYAIPRGFPFDGFNVTCANYTFEIFGWILFSIATQTITGFLFVTAGGLQMAQWAQGKHARLKKIFNGKDGNEKYPNRWIMLPPVW